MEKRVAEARQRLEDEMKLAESKTAEIIETTKERILKEQTKGAKLVERKAKLEDSILEVEEKMTECQEKVAKYTAELTELMGESAQ